MVGSGLLRALFAETDPPRGLDGLPVVGDAEERWAKRVTVVATAWFALVASWELFGPILAGHYASSASMGIIADNMLRWGVAGPVWEYTASAPTPKQYYCHHPWGIFWTTTGVRALLGRHDFVCRLPAVLLSIATPPLLYSLGRALWRPASGAMAAAAFVVLPIALSFAQFNALEVPVIAWSLLACLGFVRLVQSSGWRHGVVGTFGAAMALNADWPAFVLVGALLGFGLLRLASPARWFGPLPLGRYARWWATWATLSVAVIAGYVYAFHGAGKLLELLGSYDQRSAGNEAPLLTVLASRRYWLELCFTPVAMGLAALGLAASVLRLALGRRELEVVPVAFFVMATVQYVVFRQGADIHVFWPHYYAVTVALAAGALVAVVSGALGERLGASWRERSALYAMVACAVPLLVVLRDGVEVLAYARATGGRFNEKGLLIDSDGERIAALAWLAPSLPADARVDLHASMHPTWSQTWALGGRVVRAGAPAPAASGGAPTVFVADARHAPAATVADWASRFRVVTVGPLWVIHPEEPPGPLLAHSFETREPSLWEWAWISATEPSRAVVRDPFATWETRIHFGQPSEAPPDPPREDTRLAHEQVRIAHNAAVASGDLDRAGVLARVLLEGTTPLDVGFTDGTTLVATRLTRGASELLTLYVRAAGPSEAGVRLRVFSRVFEGPAWSTTMADPVVREVAPPPAIPSSRWRSGFLYSMEIPVRHRPGREVYRARLAEASGRLVARADGQGHAVEVLRD